VARECNHRHAQGCTDVTARYSRAFSVKVGLYQDTVPSYLLFLMKLSQRCCMKLYLPQAFLQLDYFILMAEQGKGSLG